MRLEQTTKRSYTPSFLLDEEQLGGSRVLGNSFMQAANSARMLQPNSPSLRETAYLGLSLAASGLEDDVRVLAAERRLLVDCELANQVAEREGICLRRHVECL